MRATVCCPRWPCCPQNRIEEIRAEVDAELEAEAAALREINREENIEIVR